MMRLTRLAAGCFAVAILLTLNGYAAAEETKGTIKTVDTARNEVVLKGVVKNTTYELNKDTAVSLDGRKAKLSDLKEGDKCAIIYEKKGEHLVASEVRGLRNAEEVIGDVRGTFADKNEVTLKGVVKDTTYELEKDCVVWLSAEKKGGLADLREGDRVMLTFQTRGDHRMVAEVRILKKPK